MRCVCRGNDPKKSTCVLLTRSLTHLEDGCGFPNPPLILTLPVTDWIKKKSDSERLVSQFTPRLQYIYTATSEEQRFCIKTSGDQTLYRVLVYSAQYPYDCVRNTRRTLKTAWCWL